MSNKKPDDLIGKKLGQYTIIEEIGRGGMATVYSAMQQSMNRKIAVKILPRHFMHDSDFIERFEREVEVISHLEHPHILPIYDYGESDGVPYIAMRFLGGGSMAQMVRRGVTQLNDLAKPFQQVAESLDYAHQQGIIHRDLKPGNIMLDEHGNAYLSDFGIARVMGSNLTGSAIIGTPAYMSPEQAHGINIDARSDIYSLGIVLFELITGREPYQAETPMSLLMMHINEPVPPISDFREGVPSLVQSVVDTATAKDPDNRYASASELANAFREALKGNRTSTTLIGMDTKADNQKTLVDKNLTPMSNSGGTVIANAETYKPAARVESAIPSEKHETVTMRKSSMMQIVVGLVLLVIVASGAGLFFLTDIFDAPPATIDLPSNFSLVETDDYRIGIPRSMLPAVADFIDESTANRILHRWQNTEDAYVSLALVNASRVTQNGYYTTYYEDFITNNETWRFIDETTFEDSTLRQSYRVSGDSSLANGQIDVFYITRDESLVVIEMYTSDAVGNQAPLINDLQTILDSLQIETDV